MKEAYIVLTAEYATQHKIDKEPAFAWWVPHVIKKRDRIISKVKSKYWQRTHKYGIQIPKSVAEALRLDKENGNTLWWDAICQEMANVRIAFEEYDGEGTPTGFAKINCHIIFDVKLGENYPCLSYQLLYAVQVKNRLPALYRLTALKRPNYFGIKFQCLKFVLRMSNFLGR